MEAKGIPYEYHEHVRQRYTAARVAEELDVPVAWLVKAMIVERSNGDFTLVVIPDDKQLNLKKVAEALGDKEVTLASERHVQRFTKSSQDAPQLAGGEEWPAGVWGRQPPI